MLTLNIIEHELCSVGRVVRTCGANPSFSAFRLFIEPTSLAGPDTLYLCGTRDDVGKAVSQNCQALYVSIEDDSPDERAVLSVLEGESILVVFNALLDAMYRFADWERSMDDVRFRGGGLQELLDNVRKGVDGFVKDAVQFDDLTMLCLEYEGPDAS